MFKQTNALVLKLALASACGAWSGTQASEPTAFDLMKEGNQYVSVEARDKVVEIRSEKSVAGVTPTIWYVTYFDRDAKFKATEVKFGAGKKLEVKRPFHLFERAFGDYEVTLDKARLMIDSDRAIGLAVKEPLLDRLTITATRLKLRRSEKGEAGDDRLPVWEVELWAAKLAKPNKSAGIGKLILSAEDGKTLENDLKIHRVD